MSFSAEELTTEIKKYIPSFVCKYDPDPVRQAIADSWPMSMNDDAAREEWGWKPNYDLEKMAKDMMEKLTERHDKGELYKKTGQCKKETEKDLVRENAPQLRAQIGQPNPLLNNFMLIDKAGRSCIYPLK